MLNAAQNSIFPQLQLRAIDFREHLLRLRSTREALEGRDSREARSIKRRVQGGGLEDEWERLEKYHQVGLASITQLPLALRFNIQPVEARRPPPSTDDDRDHRTTQRACSSSSRKLMDEPRAPPFLPKRWGRPMTGAGWKWDETSDIIIDTEALEVLLPTQRVDEYSEGFKTLENRLERIEEKLSDSRAASPGLDEQFGLTICPGHASSDYSDDGQVDSRETNCEQPMKSSMVTARTSPVEEQASPTSSIGASSLLCRMGQLETEMLAAQRGLEGLRSLLPSGAGGGEPSPTIRRSIAHTDNSRGERGQEKQRFRGRPPQGAILPSDMSVTLDRFRARIKRKCAPM